MSRREKNNDKFGIDLIFLWEVLVLFFFNEIALGTLIHLSKNDFDREICR